MNTNFHMNRNIYQILVAVVSTGLFFTGCKKWDDHNALTDPMAGKDLFQQISENTELSKFAELLTKSGFDKIISSSKTYTVFAPTNAALATLDPAVVADDAKLRMFVGNHIANQLYQTTSASGVLRLQMLSGKYNNLQGNKVEDANITAADRYAKNGFLHVVDKMVPALPNAWEFVETSPLMPAKQKAFLLSLFQNVFDPTNAEQIGVDPTTGKPVYKPGTDSIRTNLFWKEVYDLRDESKQYTFFVMADAAWDQEVQIYRPFHIITTNADSTTRFASRTVARDLVIEGVYQQNAIPDTIRSKFNTKVGIDKSAIVQSVKVSNGIVHIMSRLNVRPKDKFQQIVIQGENYDFSREDRRGNTFFRDKFNPLTGKDFRDVLVDNHGIAQFYLGYNVRDVPANVKYRAYWVALHDNVNNHTGTFNQLLGIGTPTANLLPYITVSPNDYREIFLGEFTLSSFRPVLNVHLTAANSANRDASKITVDYIRLEPVL